MSDSGDAPFTRDEFLDKPGIVGARWWNDGLKNSDPVSRRFALQALLVGGGILAAGVVISKASGCSSGSSSRRPSLDMQKTYGWNFGARSDSLTFDGATTQPFDPAALANLALDLTPTTAALRPFFVPTLLQSASAVPTSTLPSETTPLAPLLTLVKPIHTEAMDWSYRCGQALAALFTGVSTDAAVIVDLPGANSVAFAAGAASVLEPVITIDNWPHPHGVVPAHLTLAAFAYYQPLFAKLALSRPHGAPPLFVLDRARLGAYSDDGSQFDNRHMARLPTVANWKALGVRRILYVVPAFADLPELDDLNYDFVQAAGANLVVRVLATEAFGPDQTHAVVPSPPPPSSGATSSTPTPPADPGPVFFYGLSPAANELFWIDYPWISPSRHSDRVSPVVPTDKNYVPVARTTPFSGSMGLGAKLKVAPPDFGTVPVEIASSTGFVTGTTFGRSGSWSRSSGGWGG